MRWTFAFLAALSFCAGYGRAAEPAQTKTFEDEKKVFSFKYPANWKVEEKAAGTSASVMYAAPDDSWASNVQVNLVDAPPESAKDRLAMLNDAIIANLKTSIKDFKLVESVTYDLNKQKAQRIIFTGTQDKVALKFMQIIALRKDKTVLITCTTTEGKFADERPKFDKLAESFELK